MVPGQCDQRRKEIKGFRSGKQEIKFHFTYRWSNWLQRELQENLQEEELSKGAGCTVSVRKLCFSVPPVIWRCSVNKDSMFNSTRVYAVSMNKSNRSCPRPCIDGSKAWAKRDRWRPGLDPIFIDRKSKYYKASSLLKIYL